MYTTDIEKRAVGNMTTRASGRKKQIIGYAAVYDSPSADLGGFVEVIRRGAFDASLAENPDVACRVQHQGGLATIGRTVNGTLRLWSDDYGLRYACDLPNTEVAKDLWTLVSGRYITKSSFAFSLRENGQRWDMRQSPPLRELLSVNIHDVAPVDGPAYEATSVQARCLERAWYADHKAQGVIVTPELHDAMRKAREVDLSVGGLDVLRRPSTRQFITVLGERIPADGRELSQIEEDSLDSLDWPVYWASLPESTREHRRFNSQPRFRLERLERQRVRREQGWAHP